MTSEHYVIATDPAHALVTTVLTGRWSCATVDRYKTDLLAAGARLIAAGIDPWSIGILIDTRLFGPQAQDVVQHYARTFDEKRFQSERIAVLYKSTLLMMQTRRMAVGTPRFFEHKDEALHWLLSLGCAAPQRVGRA